MSLPGNHPDPLSTAKSLAKDYSSKAITDNRLAGGGRFSQVCQDWLTSNLGCKHTVLTHSCTAALEMAALLIDLRPGDEVIMPSYTFSSTANAVALRGGIPVFVDIRPDTFNLDESKIADAITLKTKAIVPVHYAGVGCEMDAILTVAHDHGLLVIEDAAQGIMATYKGRPLGSMGNLAALSFHQTKNLSSGEGGALVINEERWIEAAEIIAEKGTNRHHFSRGKVDHYTWTALGSSYLPSDLVAAVLLAQLEHAESITLHRLHIWNTFHQGLEDLEASGRLQRPRPPAHCQHNGHFYAVLVADRHQREDLRRWCLNHHVNATTHYVPLHASPAGRAFCRTADQLTCTESTADRLLRLPMNFPDGNVEALEHVIAVIQDFFTQA